MNGRDDALTDDQLAGLEQRLRTAAGRVDPVPPAVLVDARRALEVRDLDAEIAALVADSHDADERLALVRSTSGIRLLTFEAPGVAVELQVVSRGAERQLDCQLAGAEGVRVRLEHAAGSMDIAPDELGRFRVDVLPAGRLRLLLRMSGRTVATAWVLV